MGFPFVKGFKVADGEGLHPRSPEAHSVFGTGALLLCQPSEMVRVAGLAPATSSFRTRPSAADITPCLSFRMENAKCRIMARSLRDASQAGSAFCILKSTLYI